MEKLTQIFIILNKFWKKFLNLKIKNKKDD